MNRESSRFEESRQRSRRYVRQRLLYERIASGLAPRGTMPSWYPPDVESERERFLSQRDARMLKLARECKNLGWSMERVILIWKLGG